MEGSVGKYMSITNGPNALIVPKKIDKNVLLFCLFIVFCSLFYSGAKLLAL